MARLARCYNRLWGSEKWPQVWKKEHIVKIFKKGDLRDYSNWRGVTLLPVISKIFCQMMLEWIKIGIDKKLRKEQAGFRPKRSTTEQIFILRNILRQANEWRAGLYIHLWTSKKPLIRYTEKAYATSWEAMGYLVRWWEWYQAFMRTLSAQLLTEARHETGSRSSLE